MITIYWIFVAGILEANGLYRRRKKEMDAGNSFFSLLRKYTKNLQAWV
jgi:uncharacterized protein YfbU (UPF0304 family)